MRVSLYHRCMLALSSEKHDNFADNCDRFPVHQTRLGICINPNAMKSARTLEFLSFNKLLLCIDSLSFCLTVQSARVAFAKYSLT